MQLVQLTCPDSILISCSWCGQQSNLFILDSLLSNYDRRATPSNHLNTATLVDCELYIRSFGSIDPNSMFVFGSSNAGTPCTLHYVARRSCNDIAKFLPKPKSELGVSVSSSQATFVSSHRAATVVEWSAARVLYRVSACAERLRAGSKPGHEYELFLVSRRELALIVERTSSLFCVLHLLLQLNLHRPSAFQLNYVYNPHLVVQDYHVDLYLRQTWVDERLNHVDINQPLDLNDPKLVKAIWKPEVYFPNAKHAEFQFVTVPNVLVRVNPHGEILYMLSKKFCHTKVVVQTTSCAVERTSSLFCALHLLLQLNLQRPSAFQLNYVYNPHLVVQDYHVDLYLRQTWVDERLNHVDINQPLDLNDPKLVKAIWKPEVYFPNAKHAEFQFVTVPNVLVRVNPHGEILYMLRLKLVFSCMLDLSKFPFDSQICTMEVASFSKTMKELDLRWKKDEPIKMYRDLRMPQFEITDIVDSICQESFHIGNYSCLVAEFHMRRSLGFHLVQSYLPTILIVAISWVSFWMDIGSAPGRTTLGVTTLLTISSKSSEIQGGLPQVSYVKAIDVWMGACTAFVFCALLEFTLANYMWRKHPKPPATKPRKGAKRTQDLKRDAEADEQQCSNSNGKKGMDDDLYAVPPASIAQVSGHVPMVGAGGDMTMLAPHLLANVSTNSSRELALAIDANCRILFPLSFAVFNIFYWSYYFLY
ncbi:Neurotransmitter-gated ion-channel [Trinorchestia longiramus]|nr:Neurotransmitter-gated ion-channel [Trinorchestia longiramus]